MTIFSSVTPDQFMFFLLGLILVVGFLYIHNLHTKRNNTICIIDLITIHGRLSDRKLMRFVTWVVTTWGFIYLIVTTELPEWYFYGYIGAWVSNALVSKLIANKTGEDTPVSIYPERNCNPPPSPIPEPPPNP